MGARDHLPHSSNSINTTLFLHAQFSTSHTTDTPPPSRASANINSALREHCPSFHHRACTSENRKLEQLFRDRRSISPLAKKRGSAVEGFYGQAEAGLAGLLGLLGVMPHDRKSKDCGCVAVSQMLTQQASFEKRTRCWTRMQNMSPARPVRCPTNELTTTTIGAALQGSDIFRSARQ